MRTKVAAYSLILAGLVAAVGGCDRRPAGTRASTAPRAEAPKRIQAAADRDARQDMARRLSEGGNFSPGVLAALASVPRHEFAPDSAREQAYEPDRDIGLPNGRRMPSARMVAALTDRVVAQKAARCLAWGDPTGYHAAVLSLVFEQVYLIEPDAAHAARAAERLKKLGYANVQVRQGDFAKGWSEHAPYDAVVLSAPVYAPPEAMQAQLGVGGRMAFSVAGAPPDDMTVVQKLTDGAIGPITEATPDTAAPDAARGARPSAPE